MPSTLIRKPVILAFLCLLAVPLALQSEAYAQILHKSDKIATPDESAKEAQKFMQGFPPAQDKQITKSNSSIYSFPQIRWAFNHERELTPTRRVWRGSGPVTALPTDLKPIGKIKFKDANGNELSVDQAFKATYSDAALIVHKGKIIYESYWGEGQRNRPHILMSVTKSFIGTLAQMLVVQGAIDRNAPVVKYVPELKGSAYEDATLGNVMDMRVAVRYSEVYSDPKADVFDYAKAAGMLGYPPGAKQQPTLFEYLKTLKKQGEHGQDFDYKTVNTEVLAWVIKKVTGKSISQLVSEKFWQPMGAEEDGDFMIDAVGMEIAGGGLNVAIADLARFGMIILNNGKVGDRQVIDSAVIQDIKDNGSVKAFARNGGKGLWKGGSYRNMWWKRNDPDNSIMARGVHGQVIYINNKADLVIVKTGSNPVASNSPGQDAIMLPAYDAIAAHLKHHH